MPVPRGRPVRTFQTRLVEASGNQPPLGQPDLPQLRQQAHQIGIRTNDHLKPAPLPFVRSAEDAG